MRLPPNNVMLYRERYTSYAFSQKSLANLYIFLGDYPLAETSFKEAISIFENNFGSGHPSVALTLNDFAILEALEEKNEKSLEHMLQAQKITDSIIEQIVNFTSEKEKIIYLASQSDGFSKLISLVTSKLTSNHKAIEACYDVWIRRKGIVFEAQRQSQDVLFHSDDPKIKNVYHQLADVRTQLSRRIFAGVELSSPQIYRNEMEKLTTKKQDLESQLSMLSKTFSQNQQNKSVSIDQLVKSLPKDSVLIDFCLTQIINFNEIPGLKNTPNGSSYHYLAFIVKPDKKDRVTVVDLGSAIPIDQAQQNFKFTIQKYSKTPDSKEAYAEIQKATFELEQRVFAPILPIIGPTRKILLSPDGALNLVPFEIFSDKSGRFLIQDFTFNYLASARDLIHFGSPIITTNEKSLFLGNPNFDLDNSKKGAVLKRLGYTHSSKQHTLVSRDFNEKFSDLPETQKEIDALKQIIGTKSAEYFTEDEAIEDLLKQKKSPKILHLATHGFFLSDQSLPRFIDDPTRNIRGKSFNSIESHYIYDNPLLRSGIALAGANNKQANINLNYGNGIVTAEDILALQLQGTELVVLSACESGLGEVKSGEGVFGLRRSFLQAGARGLVMSLWSVQDEETKELMVSFYDNYLNKSMDKVQALRQASLKEMEVIRERYGYPNPYFWGAFIFAGEGS
jgi:CHAT domain-containing protein